MKPTGLAGIVAGGGTAMGGGSRNALVLSGLRSPAFATSSLVGLVVVMVIRSVAVLAT